MRFVELRLENDSPAERAAAAWQKVEAHLQSARAQINGEIRKYPPPIPACDSHFNGLLEERGRISGELDRMREFINRSAKSAAPFKLIEEFITSSDYFDAEAKRRIETRP